MPGPPGFGKSTTAQLLSREHGFFLLSFNTISSKLIATHTGRSFVSITTPIWYQVCWDSAVQYNMKDSNSVMCTANTICDICDKYELCSVMCTTRATVSLDWGTRTSLQVATKIFNFKKPQPKTNRIFLLFSFTSLQMSRTPVLPRWTRRCLLARSGLGVLLMMMIDLSCKMMKKTTICQLNDLTGEKNIFLVM